MEVALPPGKEPLVRAKQEALWSLEMLPTLLQSDYRYRHAFYCMDTIVQLSQCYG
jgi:hypothetical protein